MRRSRRSLVVLLAPIALCGAVLPAMSGGCGASKSDGFGGPTESSGSDAQASGQDDASIGSFGTSSGLGAGGAFSQGANNCPTGAPLTCYVDTNCPGGKHTTITGKVYDPAGKNPIYNVVVFVPTDLRSLPAITPGTNTCNTCSTPVGDHVAVTQTAEDGSFTLTDVPWGKNVPLVLQIGKWRRIVTVGSTTARTARRNTCPSRRPSAGSRTTRVRRATAARRSSPICTLAELRWATCPGAAKRRLSRSRRRRSSSSSSTCPPA